MIAVHRSMGGIYPGQSATRTGCDHWPPNTALSGGSAVWRNGSGTLTWSVAIHWVPRLWGFLGGEGQGQPPTVFCLGPPCLSLKQSEMAANFVGFGDSQVKSSWKSVLAVASAGS